MRKQGRKTDVNDFVTVLLSVTRRSASLSFILLQHSVRFGEIEGKLYCHLAQLRLRAGRSSCLLMTMVNTVVKVALICLHLLHMPLPGK